MTRRDRQSLLDYLEHILQAITRITSYLEGVSQSEFLVNEEKQDAVIRNLEVIGEASGNVLHHFPEFVQRYPELPLKAAYGMRNALSHGYFKIDLEIVWKTTRKDLPILSDQISDVLGMLSDELEK